MTGPRLGAPAHVARLAAWYESLKPASLAHIGEYYAPNAHFRDPFNDVHGLDAIRRVFQHMFDSLHDPRFVVHTVLADGGRAFIRWDFLFALRQRTSQQAIDGGTLLIFDPAGRVLEHLDFWDSAEVLQQVPVLGPLTRSLKKRARA